MNKYIIGQRWMSEAEPELGLGLIIEVSSKTLTVGYPATENVRHYGFKTAPLKRVLYTEGDEVIDSDGNTFVVENVENLDGLIVYHGEGQQFVETHLNHNIGFHRPLDKFTHGHFDSPELYNLRVETLAAREKYQNSGVKGLLGTRTSTIHHQYYLVSEIIKRPYPRVLLADEVGLGKTIEAGLITHYLINNQRADRVLVIVPDSLAYQWFVEMYRRFNLSFFVVNQEVTPEPGVNPFFEHEFVIVSLGLLKGSKMARDLLGEVAWDLLIVDEAHQLKWSHLGASDEYEIVESLANLIPSVLLLTATPEQLGHEGHFARLRLLDPDRFTDYDIYQAEQEKLAPLATIAKNVLDQKELLPEQRKWLEDHLQKDELVEFDQEVLAGGAPRKVLAPLLDRHGTGRVYFRNTRDGVGEDFHIFPKRKLVPHKLIIDDDKRSKKTVREDTKVSWLVDFLYHREDKVLVMAKSKNVIQFLEKKLKESISDIKISVFHSDLGFMARDRQAAYFADPDGARVLLCTEIGSEGRNFQFSNQLVLYDLPLPPDLLEQRIGRLDRIGQKHDVEIHVPYIEHTDEQTLFRWYSEVLKSFERPSKAGRFVYTDQRDDIRGLLEKYSSWKGETPKSIEKLLSEGKEKTLKYNSAIENGRDVLLELNSFDRKVASGLIEKIQSFDESQELKNYLDNVFHHLGVDSEDLDGSTMFIKPGENMFIPHFPCLEKEGMSITFDRKRGLEREDIQFITWDHPMVTQVMDFMLGQDLGNVTVGKRRKPGKIFLETIYTLRCKAPKELTTKNFFPETVMRILIDETGEDLSEKWTKEVLDPRLDRPTTENLKKLATFPKERLKAFVSKSDELAKKKSLVLKKEFTHKASRELESELTRLKELSKKNKLIKETDLEILEKMKEMTSEVFSGATLELDSFRFIF